MAAAGCGGGSPAVPPGTVDGVATAGPTCPVQPATGGGCANRPVPGATIELQAAGRTVASGVTDAAGRYSISVRPGVYTVVGDPAKGTMRPPPPSPGHRVRTGGSVRVDLVYDTGIR